MDDKFAIIMPLGDSIRLGMHVELRNSGFTEPELVVTGHNRDDLVTWLAQQERAFRQAALKAASHE